jgi:hypothetical protein
LLTSDPQDMRELLGDRAHRVGVAAHGIHSTGTRVPARSC